MSGAWEFLEDSAGRWRWRAKEGVAIRESCKTFKSGADCVAHALRHGYLAGTPLARPHAPAAQGAGQSAG